MTEPLRSSETAATAVEAAAGEAAPVEPDEQLDPRPAVPEGPRHLRVVEPGRRVRMPSARSVFLAGSGVIIAVAFGLVYLHVVMAQRQFQLDSLNIKVTQEQAQYQALRLQVAHLDSPQQIISTAEGKLGMRQPTSVVYLSAPPGSALSGSTSVSGAADPVTPGRTDLVPAPTGDADWPAIKADLAGSP